MGTVSDNLSNRFYYVPDNITLDQLKQHITQWNQPFAFEINYTSPISPAKSNAVGIAERGMLHAFDYSGRHFYCTDSTSGWQESPYALKSDLFAPDNILDPNTCTKPFAIVNGWNSAVTNVPDAIKGKFATLLTIWNYGTSTTGDLSGSRSQTLIIENNGGIFTRMYINNAWTEWERYTTDDSITARFMDMTDFTIAKIKSIYGSDIPVVGCINYTSSISPDKSTGFVFAAKHVATMITMAGNIYGLSTEDNWVKKN